MSKQAIIFSAGLGTRLKPLTDTMPKALVPVSGHPLLWHVVMKLKKAGYERIIVNVHHFAQQIIDYLQANQNFGLDIRISDERSALLETGGAIKKARFLLDPAEPVLIHNVDILSNIDLAAFRQAAMSNDAEATLLVNQRQTKRYLLFDDHLQLHGWTNIETGEVKGPAKGQDLQLRTLAFSGIHFIRSTLFPLMDEWTDRFPIIDFYLHVCDTHRLQGYETANLQLLDVGKLETLDAANEFIKLL